MDRSARKQNPQKSITPTGRIGADPCDTEHRLETSQGVGESRETNPESRTISITRVEKKIKARASAKRNKTGNGDNRKTNPRDEPKWKDKARS